MWSETVGLLRTRPKKSVLVLHSVVLVLQVWYRFVKNSLVTLVVNISSDGQNKSFQISKYKLKYLESI